MIVRADGYETLVTHFFDAESPYLDSDAVFAVKPSLIRRFVERTADAPDDATWEVEIDVVLAPSGRRGS
jgi:catechol 1,2-dioxygenase